MKSFVIFNNKGGVGKTTLLCNVAAFLKLYLHKRVLVIDADPQCNATLYMFPKQSIEDFYTTKKYSTIYDIVQHLKRGKGYMPKDNIPIYTSPGFGVDIIIGDPRFAVLEDFFSGDWLSSNSGEERGLLTTFIFKDLAYKLSVDYDYIIYDVGPSLGAINRNVLIGCDYFIIPMSSDIFSQKAIENIAESLAEWKKYLNRGLEDFKNKEGYPYNINNVNVNFCIQFLGYVNQQYTAKKKEGTVRPVKAYDAIIRKFHNIITTKLSPFYPELMNPGILLLGEIPTLHSLVPLSQAAHKPIFQLSTTDGVVGAHFKKVSDFKAVIEGITKKILCNIDYYDQLAD